MHGVKVLGDYFDKGWGWPPEYRTLGAILGPAIDFLSALWWDLEQARLQLPREWFDVQSGRTTVPATSPLKRFERVLIGGSGEARIVGPGGLAAIADLVSSDGSILRASNDASFAASPQPPTAI